MNWCVKEKNNKYDNHIDHRLNNDTCNATEQLYMHSHHLLIIYKQAKQTNKAVTCCLN